MKIATSYKTDNPLLKGLADIGIEIMYYQNFANIELQTLDKFDVWFGNLFSEIKYPRILISIKKYLTKNKGIYVFWNRDAPWNCNLKFYREWLIKYLNPIDFYFTHSGQENIPCQHKYYLANAAANEYICPIEDSALDDESSYEYDISFYGSYKNTKNYGCYKRKKFLQQIEPYLKNKNYRIKFIDSQEIKLGISDQIELMKKTKINLNYGATCDLKKVNSWGIPERVFGIPATGSFLLTDYRKNIKQTFLPGLCDYYLDIKDCIKKIDFYLNNFKYLRNRAITLQKNIIDNHTYQHRAQQFLQIIEKYFSKEY